MALAALILGIVALSPPAQFTVTLHGEADPALAEVIRKDVNTGAMTVVKFFGANYPTAFTVDVFQHRADLDAEFKKRWNAPPTEKWMVGAGIADGLILLSPKAWKTEAAEHDGDNQKEVRRIITHELTHVYHGQRNPNHDFDGMDELGWFVEGLATYVSGQLHGRELSAKQAIEAGKDPKALADAWKGPYRYGVSGSIVRYVDLRYGRRKLTVLLKLTNTASILRALGTTEGDLLRDWRASVQKGN